MHGIGKRMAAPDPAPLFDNDTIHQGSNPSGKWHDIGGWNDKAVRSGRNRIGEDLFPYYLESAASRYAGTSDYRHTEAENDG